MILASISLILFLLLEPEKGGEGKVVNHKVHVVNAQFKYVTDIFLNLKSATFLF